MSVLRVERVPYSVAEFGSLLTHDFAHDVASATSFFSARDWRAVAAQIDAHPYPRQELGEILSHTALEFTAPAPVMNNIARLKAPNSYAVITGQQAGLLGGPLYSLHKALTAIKLARNLEAASGGTLAFIPVFWVAADDHDLAEIDHAYFLETSGELTNLRATLTPESLGRCAGDAFVAAPALNALRDELRRLLADENAAAKYAELYRARSLGDAFTALMLEWLGPEGLVVARSTDLRPLAREVLVKDLDGYDTVMRLIAEAGLSLTQAGYAPGFPNPRRAPHFFIDTQPGKLRAGLDVVEPGAVFREYSQAFEPRGLAPRTYTRDELRTLLNTHPQRFSAAAPLRPVVQQTIFPVIAAVLGPGEMAYWAQLKGVHAFFGAVWPMIVPRATLTLVPPAGQKAARKLGVAPHALELFQNPATLEKRLLTNPESAQRIDLRRRRILTELEALAQDVNAVHLGLQPLFQKAQTRVEHELARIALKTQQAVGDRTGVARRRVRFLLNLVRPRGLPQERVLTVGQFLHENLGLVADLLGVIDPAAREHLIVML